MSTHSPTTRDAAIADYYASSDTAVVVAARHGVPVSTFRGWLQKGSGLAYVGGWTNDRGVMRPLFPERRDQTTSATNTKEN